MESNLELNNILVRAAAVTSLSTGYLNQLYEFFLFGLALMLIGMIVWPKPLKQILPEVLAEHGCSITMFVAYSWFMFGFGVSPAISLYIIFSVSFFLIWITLMVYLELDSKWREK